MEKKFLYVGGPVVIAVILAVLLLPASQDPAQPTGQEKIKIFASFFPYYEFAKNIAGDRAVVGQYLPAGIGAHDWEPRPGEIQSLKDADIFVYNGIGMEPYVENLIESGEFENVHFVKAAAGLELLESGRDGQGHEEGFKDEIAEIIKEFEEGHIAQDRALLDIRTAIEHEGGGDHGTKLESIEDILDNINSDTVPTGDGLEAIHRLVSGEDIHADKQDQKYDPHVWLDPILVKQQVGAIRDSLITADPANAKYYKKNAADYNSKLDALDTRIKTGLSGCALDTFVPFHNAFAYFAKQYGLGVFSIGGITPDAEATASEIAMFVDYVRDNDIRVIFSEDLVDPRLAKVIAEEAGAQVMIFSPIEALTPEEAAQGVTFLGKMEQNLDVLRTALECQ